jgi:FeS assembly SUF system regulator
MLRISKLSDYAIVLLCVMAKQEGRTLTARSLAQATGVTAPTVTKLLKQLAAHGLLRSVQGRRGGYGLARDAAAITLTEIIEAVDGPIAMTECNLDEHDCGIEESCNAQTHWRLINVAVRQALSGVSLDALTAPTPSVPVTWHASPPGLGVGPE